MHGFSRMKCALLAAALTLSTSAAPPPTPIRSDISVEDFRRLLEHLLLTSPEIVREALVRADAVEEARQQAEARRTASELVQKAHAGTSAMPMIGPVSARVTIVQLIDYRCPFCQLMHPETARLLRERPDVRVAFVLTAILGKESERLARFALAAEEQGKFETVHDALLAASAPIGATDDALQNLASETGMDWSRAQAAMKSAVVSQRLQSMQQSWESLHQPGTPFTIIDDDVFAGLTTADDLAEALPAPSGSRTNDGH